MSMMVVEETTDHMDMDKGMDEDMDDLHWMSTAGASIFASSSFAILIYSLF